METEREFASWFEDLLRLRGWRFYHSRPAFERGRYRTALSGDPGFPDYVCVKGAEVLFVELKAQDGRIGRHQKNWLLAFNRASVERSGAFGVYVWRPSDRDDIMRVLT